MSYHPEYGHLREEVAYEIRTAEVRLRGEVSRTHIFFRENVLPPKSSSHTLKTIAYYIM